MTTSDMTPPEVLWAQRTNLLYLKINMPDITRDELDITDSKISFKGENGENHKTYGCEFEFFKPVDSSLIKRGKTGRGLFLTIPKKTDEAYWPRLTAGKAKLAYVRVDFELWKDEDEEEEEADALARMAAGGMGDMPFEGGAGMPEGFDFNQMLANASKGGAPNFDNEEKDSDDEEEEAAVTVA